MKKIIGLFILVIVAVHSYAQTNPIALPEGYTFPYWPEYNHLEVSDLGTIQEQPWVNSDHVVDGWDWSFPSFVTPSPRSLLALQRITNLNRDFEPVNLQFEANSIGILWVNWRDIEPTMGNYDFSRVKSRIEQANRSGSDIILRVLCHARGNASNPTGGQAPLWLDDLGVDYAQSTGNNLNYNPLHPAFHDRYIKLINKMAEEGIPDMVKAAYVGYASSSYGDEGIGPYSDGDQRNAEVPEVVERIDTWAEAFKGQEYKVFMGAPLHYGFDKGFGVRRGFVEMYLYSIPNSDMGQYIDQDGYLNVDESAPIIANEVFHGEVNEEYGDGFVAGTNPFLLYRFGYTTDGFPYRYFMSALRTLQMRCTYTHITGHLVPQMLPFVAQELGRTVEDAPSVWSFLTTTYMKRSNYANNDDRDPPRTFTQTEINEGIEMKNFERWLYQRDAPGYETTPAVKILHAYKQWMVQTDKNYDYIARSGKKMGFDVDDRWVGIQDSVAIKVSYFDYHAGELKLTYNDGTDNVTKTQSLTGDEELKTATFFASNIAPNAISENEFDFILEAGDGTESIVVSMVRVVYAAESTGQLGTFSLNTSATNGQIILNPPGGIYNKGTEVTITAKDDLGYAFVSWSGDFSGTENPVKIIMNDDTDLTANYISVPVYNIESQAKNGIIAMSPEGGMYEEGTRVTLSARHDYFFEFDSWDGDVQGNENPVSIIVDSDKKVKALFNRVKEGEVVAAINCGGEEFRSKDGIVYSADKYSVGGNSYHAGGEIEDTEDDELFYTYRIGAEFSYNIPLENGTYMVNLMFAECYFNNPGMHVFNMSMEGETILSNSDIWSIVSSNKAHTETYEVNVNDGELNLDFSAVSRRAKISAINVIRLN